MNNDNEKNIILDDEKDILLDHDYDGIQELDHPLPSWWLATFWGGILFGIPYILYYLVAGGLTLNEEHKISWEQVQKVKAEAAKSLDNFSIEEWKAFDAKEDTLKKGLAVFEENCLSCHAENGKGDIGPNLTDKYWIHANGTPETIFKVVRDGVEENGMPIWSEVLEKEEMFAVVSYLMSIKNTNIAGGKEPQGNAVE